MANDNAGAKLYISSAAVAKADLNQAAFEALTWVQVGSVGSVGETGLKTNITNYDTWDTDVIQKGKGMSNAGDPQVEVSRVPTDAGQILLRAAALTKYDYAFKIERADKPDDSHTNTILYNRGMVAGPTRPNGRNEDFDLEVYTLALQQREIVVDPAVIP